MPHQSAHNQLFSQNASHDFHELAGIVLATRATMSSPSICQWNWQINDRHQEQMRIVWPEFASHGECCRVDRPRAFPDDLGGQCCRWTLRRLQNLSAPVLQAPEMIFGTMIPHSEYL